MNGLEFEKSVAQNPRLLAAGGNFLPVFQSDFINSAACRHDLFKHFDICQRAA